MLSTMPSSPPMARCASSIMRRTSASDVTSAAIAKASPPSSVMRLTVCSAEVRLRSATATLAPSSAHRMLMARPLPIVSVAASNTRWPPPTIRMRRPLRRPLPGASPSDSALGGGGERPRLRSGSVISGARLLAAVIDRHAGRGIEIGFGRLGDARHHHIEAEGDDRFDDLLVAEMFAHGGEDRRGNADVLDHFAA